MNTKFAVIAIAFASGALFSGGQAAIVGCNHPDVKSVVKDAAEYLDEASLACIFISSLVDAAELTRACKLADKLVPVVQNLIRQREGARMAGVRWLVPDAGAVTVDGGKL